MLVKYSTLWLLTLPLSPCNLYYLSIISSLLTLAFAGDIAFFIYRVLNVVLHNVVFNTTCMYTCIFIKLHITAQSGPVLLVILCHSH